MSIIKNKPFKAFLTSWIYNSNIAFWEHLMACLIALFMLYGCGQIKYVPMQTEEKVIVRDSIIKVIDTLEIEVPKEVVKEVIPQIDTSVLETSVAKSVAFLDTTKRKIHHTLEQKGKVKTIIDTCYITQTVEKIVYKDRPVEVQVPKRDSIFWYSIIFNIIILLIAIMRLFK